MKQCAVCSRTYADDTLEFCLDDGARLFLALDADATRVRAEQPTAVTPAWPPQPLPPPDWSNQPAPVQPVPAARKRNWLPLALLLLAGAGLIIGAAGLLLYLNQPSSKPAEVADDATPKPVPTPRVRASAEETPEATPAPKPSPKATATQKPTPDAKPTPEDEPTVKPTPKPVSGGCMAANDDASQPEVNLRANCHVKSCDDDDSTKIGALRNGTPITVNRQVAPVRGRNFAWQQVTTRDGRIGWIAASKIRCQ